MTDTSGGRFGLGYVTLHASTYVQSFRGWNANDCGDVEELPVGTYVIVLRGERSDIGWLPVVVNDERGKARFTLVHPQSVRVFHDSELGGQITVGHTCYRGRHRPAPDLGDFGQRERTCGVLEVNEQLVLDARWTGRGQTDTPGCSGFCASVCAETAKDADRVGDILNFAARRRQGIIVCERAKHRSVSAAKILELVCRRQVDYSYAVRPRCDRCCKKKVEDDLNVIWNALRNLPTETNSTVLLFDALFPRIIPEPRCTAWLSAEQGTTTDS